jgi:hypothetical protein
MDQALFERLLYEEESTTLDFKNEQYHFAKAGENEKSELLKDIIGFANAWRRSEAYILIGVDEVRGGRSNVVGIVKTDHLDDHSLQQFVNSLANRPVRFAYEAFGFEGKQVGIIRIEEQPRPIYLKRDYGKLEKEKVYVRRGSSINLNKPASLEEISQMGQGVMHQSAELGIEFAAIGHDETLGTSVSWDAEFVELPPMEAIPELTEKTRIPSWESLTGEYVNHKFYWEFANFEFARRLFRPIRLLVRNIGQVSANNVQADLIISRDTGVLPVISSKIPALPKRKFSKYTAPDISGISSLRRYPGQVTIDSNDDLYRIEIDCGDLQPGRNVWSDVLYLAKEASGEIEISGQIFAGNLPRPKNFILTASIKVLKVNLTLSELLELSETKKR